MISGRTLIIGIGNRYRRDDGVGPAVAESLQERGIEAIAFDGDGAALMELWTDRTVVVLIDATRSGAVPGSFRSWDGVRESLPRDAFHGSSHLFGVAQAVETARILGRLPERLEVHGIEGADFRPGEGLTAAVAASVARLSDSLARRFLPCESVSNGVRIDPDSQ